MKPRESCYNGQPCALAPACSPSVKRPLPCYGETVLGAFLRKRGHDLRKRFVSSTAGQTLTRENQGRSGLFCPISARSGGGGDRFRPSRAVEQRKAAVRIPSGETPGNAGCVMSISPAGCDSALAITHCMMLSQILRDDRGQRVRLEATRSGDRWYGGGVGGRTGGCGGAVPHLKSFSSDPLFIFHPKSNFYEISRFFRLAC